MCRCVMCRAEAHQLYARKPIFDAMGIQLVVCLNEHIDAEVCSLPHYFISFQFLTKAPDVRRGSVFRDILDKIGWDQVFPSPNGYMLIPRFSFIIF